MANFGNTEKQYHIDCSEEDVGRYVLLPGSPDRVPLIASFLENAKECARKREYLTYTGFINGTKVSVTSTGIGGPSTAIAVEELAKIGADTFIRVGTSGIMQNDMRPGDLIVATAAIRDEGTSHQYLPAAFPAVAHPDVVQAFIRACQKRNMTHHIGVVHSKDSFYGEVESARMPMKRHLEERWQCWIDGGALCSEMEAATLFVVSSFLRKRAGAIMMAGGTHYSVEELCRTAVQGIRELIERDTQRP
ncbi:MAG: nucleoside phosphorylase [Myxococcota bacterium]|nr:nucleoside phosphorylase [Myxococcota bacterium]